MTTKFDLYETITRRIIDKLNNGIIPWKKPWTADTTPVNHTNNRPYRGINVFLLPDTYKHNRWLTFNQCQALKGSIKSGEKSSMVVYWTMFEVEDKESGETKKIPFLKYYNVFNIEQTTLSYIPDTTKDENVKIPTCEEIVEEYNDCPLITTGSKASYSPSLDVINIPNIDNFHTSEDYYSTLFHELTHSTGSKNRLDRKLSVSFGSENYAKEELIAEMGASFLCGICNIEMMTEDNSVSYIQSWIKALQNDKKMIVSAAGLAQKAVDYIREGKKGSDDNE